MEYFTVKAPTYEAAVRKIQELYGDHARIHSRKLIRKKGLFGRGKEEVEVTGFLASGTTQSGEGRSTGINSGDSADASGSERLGTVLAELEKLREQLHNAALPSESTWEKTVNSILQENDFSPSFRQHLNDVLQSDFPEGIPEDLFLLESAIIGVITDSLKIAECLPDHPPRVMVIMGPTGVGKTTTIAKIAAMQSLGTGVVKNGRNKTGGNNTAIVSIDNFRIGARSQIETYGEIMSVPVSNAESPMELDAFLHENSTKDFLLIDTIGKSPRDIEIYDEMRRILSVCDSSTHFTLALAASMKYPDMIETVKRFSTFPISSLTITKMDETGIVGNIISLVQETGIPLLYFATGQKVPQDLQVADKGFLLQQLKNFSVDVANIHSLGRGAGDGENTRNPREVLFD